MKDIKPTQQFEVLYEVYQYFNVTLFSNELPDCFLNFSRGRSRRTMGFFSPNTWIDREAETQKTYHEISICPDFIGTEVEDVFSTLAHEMAHLWQEEFGHPSKGGYHNKEWAKRMISIGLFPSNTGSKGGKITGYSMSHYVLPNKAFAKAYLEIPEHLKLPLMTKIAEFKQSQNFLVDLLTNGEIPSEEDIIAIANEKRGKVKYTCADCKNNVWGKPYLNIICRDCNVDFYISL